LANIAVNARVSSVTGNPLYVYYSLDGGASWTQLGSALTSGCNSIGTTANFSVGTTVTFYIARNGDPNTGTAYGTGVVVTGACPNPTTVTTCNTSPTNQATPVTGGTLTVWMSANIAVAGC
jgi:hypothetical protein